MDPGSILWRAALFFPPPFSPPGFFFKEKLLKGGGGGIEIAVCEGGEAKHLFEIYLKCSRGGTKSSRGGGGGGANAPPPTPLKRTLPFSLTSVDLHRTLDYVYMGIIYLCCMCPYIRSSTKLTLSRWRTRS